MCPEPIQALSTSVERRDGENRGQGDWRTRKEEKEMEGGKKNRKKRREEKQNISRAVSMKLSPEDLPSYAQLSELAQCFHSLPTHELVANRDNRDLQILAVAFSLSMG